MTVAGFVPASTHRPSATHVLHPSFTTFIFSFRNYEILTFVTLHTHTQTHAVHSVPCKHTREASPRKFSTVESFAHTISMHSFCENHKINEMPMYKSVGSVIAFNALHLAHSHTHTRLCTQHMHVAMWHGTQMDGNHIDDGWWMVYFIGCITIWLLLKCKRRKAYASIFAPVANYRPMCSRPADMCECAVSVTHWHELSLDSDTTRKVHCNNCQFTLLILY